MKLHNTKERLDVQKSDLSGSVFHDVNLSGCDLDDINMSGWRVKNVNFSGLHLSDANLAGAALSACRYEGMTIDGIPLTDLIAAYKAAPAPKDEE